MPLQPRFVTDDRRILDRGTSDIEESVAKIAAEFRAGFEKVAEIDRPAVALFGSARVQRREASRTHGGARTVGRKFGEAGWAVVTGGGPGVMEAANRGAQEGGGLSVGFNIHLPHEQGTNAYLDIAHTFDHFYAQGVLRAPVGGVRDLPGGFGTLDELYESLTLIQTGKILHFPVVLFGSDYWGEMLDWLKGEALDDGMISAADFELLHVTDDPDDAVRPCSATTTGGGPTRSSTG